MTQVAVASDMNLDRLFAPERIAIIGASNTEGKIGYEAMANAVRYDGEVYPVNPNGEGTVFGEPFVDSVGNVDEGVDLALLCVPASAVPEVVAECGEAGVGAAVIYAGGFAEVGEEGERLQGKTAAAANEHGVALLGPNTSGFVVPRTNLLASFAGGVEQIPPGDVAVVAQSGGVAHVLAFQALHQGYGLSAMVGLGNRVNVGFESIVEYFDDDPATGSVILHVEGVDHGRLLVETCRAASTPVLAYKVGETDVGEFATSHTGTLTGDHDLYTAGFAQYGVPTAESTAELLDAGHALSVSPEPAGKNVGVVTAQAGPGIIIADRLQQAGATMPELGDDTQDRMSELLPGITYTDNPVDTGRPMPRFGEVVRAVAEDDAVDIVLVYELFEEALGFPVNELDGLADEVDKPVLFATDGPDTDMAEQIAALQDAGVPVYRSPERGADAAALVARYADLSAEEVAADA